jgi:hypothetical protein
LSQACLSSLQSITARARNTFGGAETLEANVSLGTKIRRAYHASLSFPLTPTLKTAGIFSVFGLDRDNSSYASSTEGVRGFKAVIRVRTNIYDCETVNFDTLVDFRINWVGTLTTSSRTRLCLGTLEVLRPPRQSGVLIFGPVKCRYSSIYISACAKHPANLLNPLFHIHGYEIPETTSSLARVASIPRLPKNSLASVVMPSSTSLRPRVSFRDLSVLGSYVR